MRIKKQFMKYIDVPIIPSTVLCIHSCCVVLSVRALQVSISCFCLHTSFGALTHCHSIKGHLYISDAQIEISSLGLSRETPSSIPLVSSLASQFKNWDDTCNHSFFPTCKLFYFCLSHLSKWHCHCPWSFFLLHFLQESSPDSLPMKASCIMTGLNTDIFFGQLDSK